MNIVRVSYFLMFIPRFNLFLMVILFILLILERQRSPIDLAERERELVSGYNIEFSSIFFTLIFLSEYLNIVVLSGIFCYLILKLSSGMFILVLFLMLIVRSCYPRIRYDTLLQIF